MRAMAGINLNEPEVDSTKKFTFFHWQWFESW